MQFPKFESDGSYSLIVRPEPVLFIPRSPQKNTGSFLLIKIGVSKMNKKLLAVTGLVVGSIGSASAAVDAAVSTALSDAKTDVGTIGAAALLIVIGIAVFRYMKRSA